MYINVHQISDIASGGETQTSRECCHFMERFLSL